MAYGLLLYKEIIAPEGTHRLEVHKDGYTGQAVEIDGLVRDSIVLSKNAGEVSDAIVTSVLSFGLYDTGQIDYTQFFTPNATLFKVVLKLDGTTRWTGFLTPDSYSENLAYRDIITLTARDNLGRLNDYDFSLGRGQLLSVRAIINAGLSVAGVAMQTTFSTAKVASDPATILAVDGLVNTTLLVGRSWHEALDLLLRGLGLTLAWNEGNTFDVRDISQAPATTQAAYFISKSGFRQIRPAWKNLTIEQDYGRRDNFYEGQFSKADCGGTGVSARTFTPPSGGHWSSSFALLNPYNGAPTPYETIFVPVGNADTIAEAMTYSQWVPALDRAITLSVRCSNSAWEVERLANAIWAQRKIQTGMSQGTAVKREYALRYRFNVFLTVGGTRYILRETWEVYNAATIAEPYLYFSMPGTSQGVDMDEEVKIYIGELPGSGTLEFVVYKPLAYIGEDTGGDPIAYSNPNDYGRLTDIALSVDEGVGARAKRIAINAVHNVQGTIGIGLGQVPAYRGNALLYLGGLYYTDNDHTPLEDFARATGSTVYDLLELVAREHITYNNDNYDALSGTMMAGAALRFDKAVAYGGKTYRIVGASLAIISNTLTAQLLQEEASFDTTAYAIDTVDDEGRSTTTGGTGAIGQGAVFSSEVLKHLRLETLNEGTSDERLVIVADITLMSEGNLVAGGIGGDTPGGGGGSIATLADVTLTNLAGGDILRYDATTLHWVNQQPALSMLSDVDLSGTLTDGLALCYNFTTGKWEPRAGGAGPVAVTSDNATIGTSLTRIATVAGVEIKAKIAEYLLASLFTGQNIVNTIGINTVARAGGDAVGNNLMTTYAASLSIANGNLRLMSMSGQQLSAITGANVVTYLIGNNAVARATADANGKTIASQEWVNGRNFLTSHQSVSLASGTNNGTLKITTAAGTVDNIAVKGLGSLAFASSVAWSNISGKPTTISGYGITDAKIANGVITLGGNTITPITSVSVSNKNATIGTTLTTIATVQGTDIKAKIAAYLLASDFNASNIVATIATTPVKRATADGNGNVIADSYLRKNTDDTMAGNLTVGTASANKTLTLRGSTSAALNIYGGNNLTSIYRDATYLQISSALRVSGNIVATGNIVAGTASDRRLKDHIKTMGAEQAIGVLKALRPVTFEWNEVAGELGGFSGDSRGFVADEYNRIIGNATRKIWGTYDAIDYQQAIPYLVAGWQAQQQRIEALTDEIERLKRRLGDGI